MTNLIRALSATFGIAMLLIATGCTSTPDPTPAAVTIQAAAAINPNEEGTPSPVVVRIYELKGVKAFNNADFFDFDDETATLGADLLASREYEMTPGSTKEYESDISSEATHLGVVVGFREIDKAQWRTSFQLEQGDDVKLLINLTGISVTIQELKRSVMGLSF
ncbi:type VI secretion system lipoprotein TssJ [uncultured Cohaesibacter sp.]|uniref:type VI secretion system lipoprotein TssJ n=1 Tax=uncultured Cohaesibacter sp. TaxID=1002546 RepID=UPI0029C88A27|nr:type VI secretion system lipoprotein TssJ [uncultured Cohaesibacter sp.]